MVLGGGCSRVILLIFLGFSGGMAAMAEAFLCEALTLLRLSKGDGQQQRRTNP